MDTLTPEPLTPRQQMLAETTIDTTGKCLWELIVERAEATPDKRMAIDERDRVLTYGEYRTWSERVAAGLAARGIGAGSHVSWVLPSRFEAMVLAAALARLGAIQNPILPIYRAREVGFIARQSECTAMVVPGVFRGFDYTPMAIEATEGLGVDVIVADPDLPEVDPSTLPPFVPAFDDCRWLFYSSGTTADPKGAKHSDHTMSASNAGMQWSMEVGPDDKAAVVFPITHVGGLVWLFNAMQTGVELLMVETFSPTETPKWLGDHGVTCAGAGTVFWQMYLAAQRALPAGERLMPDVRIFNGGGAPKPKTLNAEMMAEMGAPLIGGWGMTESVINTMVHVDDPDIKKAETDGRACPDVLIRLVIDGHECGPNEEGELRLKGPQVCLGYLDSSLDADAFDEDGWFRTGDLGVIDSDGWISITGRLKDIIIRKGENISAKEIEDLLHGHPAIADAAVIGLPDDRSGERACAVMVLRDGQSLTLAEMVEYLKSRQLPMYKIPEQLEIVDILPRNPTGKVLKKDLRATYGGTA
ncbi:MAG: AMP-dependent synthetase and ligase [Ilumatobacteraceae bacterium]|nr:AMP-dependent synthetase and ligase [Ilumatobacteraceae bacterium]